uniref:Uncharacterized protein n=1 Tax=Anopheles atroparvus TaxID=41427 RepID=A0A182IPU7_ANOAO
MGLGWARLCESNTATSATTVKTNAAPCTVACVSFSGFLRAYRNPRASTPTVAVEENHADRHQQRVPVELHGRLGGPGEPIEVDADPAADEDDNRDADELRHQIEDAEVVEGRGRRATSGKSSKFDVSSIERTSTGMAAGRSRVLRVVRAERRIAHQHLVHDHAERPPVAGRTVPGLQEHLRRDIVRRTDRAVRERPPVALPAFGPPLRIHRAGAGADEVGRFCLRQVAVEVGTVRLLQAGAEPKVGQLQVAARIEQQVVGLDVTVYKAEAVDRVDRQGRFDDVELTFIAYTWPVSFFCTSRTSPNAPRPITFSASKSSTPRRDRFRRKNSVSFWACCMRFSCRCDSDRVSSFSDASSFAWRCFRSPCLLSSATFEFSVTTANKYAPPTSPPDYPFTKMRTTRRSIETGDNIRTSL